MNWITFVLQYFYIFSIVSYIWKLLEAWFEIHYKPAILCLSMSHHVWPCYCGSQLVSQDTHKEKQGD